MSGKFKSKTQTKTVIKKISPEEELKALKNLQSIVIMRYSVYLGRKHLMGLKMKECAPELQRLRKIHSEINKLYEEAESAGKLNVSELKKLKKIAEEVKKEYRKKAKPYDERIKPLTKQIKYLDILIMNHPTIKPSLKPIVSIDEVPEELRVATGDK